MIPGYCYTSEYHYPEVRKSPGIDTRRFLNRRASLPGHDFEKIGTIYVNISTKTKIFQGATLGTMYYPFMQKNQSSKIPCYSHFKQGQCPIIVVPFPSSLFPLSSEDTPTSRFCSQFWSLHQSKIKERNYSEQPKFH